MQSDTTTATTNTTMPIDNPIYKMYFAHHSLLPSKIFDSPTSQLFRLENTAHRLLPRLKPTSDVIPERRVGGATVEGRFAHNIGHVVWLEEEGAASRGSLIAKGLGMNRRIGGRARGIAEQTVRKHLNKIHQVINLFRK